MNKGIIKLSGTILAGFLIFLSLSTRSYASDDGTFVTISVEATDDNEGLTYALDSTDPEKFTENPTFQVENGSTHTIYVKDVAGNISSRTYTASDVKEASVVTENPQSTGAYAKDEKTDTEVTVDVDLYSRSNYAGKGADHYESYAGEGANKEAAEPGGGTVYDKTETDGSTNGDKVFYTVSTKSGEVFYMIVDQKSSDNNVYLLDQVTLTDLKAMAEDNLDEAESSETKALLNNLNDKPKEESIDDILSETGKEEVKKKSGGVSLVNILIVLLIIGAIGGGYYYLKVYREKRDERIDLMEAMDRDDFEVEDNRKIEDNFDDDDEVSWPMEEESGEVE